MAKKKTKSYPEFFRREAVKLADQPDRTAADVALVDELLNSQNEEPR